MKRLPMLGDVIRLGNSPIENLVIATEGNFGNGSTAFVFTTVTFMSDAPMPKNNTSVYQVTHDQSVVGPKRVFLEDVHFVQNAKIKETPGAYIFRKTNK